MNIEHKLKELTAAEIDMVSGGVKWSLARPSNNVFIGQKGKGFAMSKYKCVPLRGY